MTLTNGSIYHDYNQTTLDLQSILPIELSALRIY